jgi:hypothetical protein
MYWVLSGLVIFFAGLATYWKIKAQAAGEDKEHAEWLLEAYQAIDDTREEMDEFHVDGKPFITDRRPRIFGDGYESN